MPESFWKERTVNLLKNMRLNGHNHKKMGDIHEQKGEEAIKPEETKEQHIERNEKGQFLKGSSGNPYGRPEGTISITTVIKQKLREVPKGKKRTFLELFVDRLVQKSIVEGSERIIKLIWNYVDGLPKQSIQLEGNIKANVAMTEEEEKLIKDAIEHARAKIGGEADQRPELEEATSE